ncbi:GlsB/YeaQ/YmgE family stress response membrane protein [Virgisporangium ochraceum]|uniref:Membrane protein n=1 Tax=Virgisporangium ochraceum TaxID=65505 RepID=A0A8J4EDL1_9ACTN|nr:GlsB/YeaQ/YmgE family stress response membrane protein [Virgisporangium ochraceum]GIJ71665.1 membrane protein [Virgisporangium ochraceum]
MEISGIVSAVFIGLVIGGLGRLVVPGRQRIGFWLTLLVGVVAALLGTVVAGVLGVAETRGVDWVELILQVGFAAAGVTIVDGMRHRRALSR